MARSAVPSKFHKLRANTRFFTSEDGVAEGRMFSRYENGAKKKKGKIKRGNFSDIFKANTPFTVDLNGRIFHIIRLIGRCESSKSGVLAT